MPVDEVVNSSEQHGNEGGDADSNKNKVEADL
jgi:hypothetical protein